MNVGHRGRPHDPPGGGPAARSLDDTLLNALRLSEARLAGIIHAAMDAIITLDSEQRILVFNQAAEQIFRCPAAEVLGQPIDRFIPERFRAAHREHIRAFGTTGVTSRSMGAPGPLVALRADGEEFPIEATISQVEVEAETLFTLILRDISERQQVEVERARTAAEQQRLRAALTHERWIIQTLVERILRDPPPLSGLQVATRYEPASQWERVGGDFFDFIPLDHQRLGVVIGDVCGKGVGSALYAIMARDMLRAFVREDPSPQTAVTRLNRALYHEMSDESSFLSLVYAVVDLAAGTLRHTTAGHPPPVLHNPVSGHCERLEVTGGLVGAIAGLKYEEQTVPFPPNALLALFTDGVGEAGHHFDPLGDGGVTAILDGAVEKDPSTIARAIFDSANDRAGGQLGDDVAIVVLRRL